MKKRTKLLACFFRPLIHDIKISRGQKFWLEIKFWLADESTPKYVTQLIGLYFDFAG